MGRISQSAKKTADKLGDIYFQHEHKINNKEMKKIKTFTLEIDEGKLIDTSIENIIESLRHELIESDVQGYDDSITLTIKVEKIFTQEEFNNLPEFGGF